MSLTLGNCSATELSIGVWKENVKRGAGVWATLIKLKKSLDAQYVSTQYSFLMLTFCLDRNPVQVKHLKHLVLVGLGSAL